MHFGLRCLILLSEGGAIFTCMVSRKKPSRILSITNVQIRTRVTTKLHIFTNVKDNEVSEQNKSITVYEFTFASKVSLNHRLISYIFRTRCLTSDVVILYKQVQNSNLVFFCYLLKLFRPCSHSAFA